MAPSPPPSRVLWRLVPALVVLLAVSRGALVLAALRTALSALLRVVIVAGLLVGGGIVWTLLRTWQQNIEMQIYDDAWLQARFFDKYRRMREAQLDARVPRTRRASSDNRNDHRKIDGKTGTNQLHAVQDLPLETYLRTARGLPSEICEELAKLVQAIVRDYIQYWFVAVSPHDETFPRDVARFLGDLIGALVGRVRQIESTEALLLVSKWIDLARLHLGWFREAYAQLAEEHPQVFQSDNDHTDSERHLARRQELLAAFVQNSQYLHPACMTSPLSSSSKQPTSGSKAESNEDIYLRHVATQLLGQLNVQLGQQARTNSFAAMGMHLLREVVAFKVLHPLLEYTLPRYSNEVVASFAQAIELPDEQHPTAPLPTAPTSSAAMVMAQLKPSTQLKNIRTTGSFLYRASKRSSVQAEAALQAMLEVVAGSTSATSPRHSPDQANELEHDDPEHDMMLNDMPLSPTSSNEGISSPPASTTAGVASRAGRAVGNLAAFGSFSSRLKPSRFLPTSTSSVVSPPFGPSAATATMREMKSVTATLGSGINASFGKVKRTFGGIGEQLRDPFPVPLAAATSAQAAKMRKMPGKLLQRAWRRNPAEREEPAADALSPRAVDLDLDNANEAEASSADEAEMAMTPQDRLLHQLDVAIANFARLGREQPERQRSPRSRELFELLAALEDVLMLGYRRPTIAAMDDAYDASQLYWNYLAQDRPETPFLNKHWRVVAKTCAPCRESEAFYSTRGLQWLLLALEKGLLWEFFTALHLHRALTNAFYDASSAMLCSSARTEALLLSLFRLNKVRVSFDLAVELGRAKAPLSPSNASLPIEPTASTMVESVWEVERYLPLQGWTATPHQRSDALPSSEWVWDSNWTLDGAASDGECDNDHENDPDHDHEMDKHWQFAPALGDAFHDKERKFDAVRRRKWTRRRHRLPPVLIAAAAVASSPPPLSPIAQARPPKPTEIEPAWNVESDDDEEVLWIAPAPVSTMPPTKEPLRQPSDPPSPRRASLKSPRSSSHRDKAMSGHHSDGEATINSAAPVTTAACSTSKPHTSLVKRLRPSRPSFRLRRTPSALARTTRHAESTDERDHAGSEGDDAPDDLWCVRCLSPLRHATAAHCQSCRQSVCATCHAFFAFLVYPPPTEQTVKDQVCSACCALLTRRSRVPIAVRVQRVDRSIASAAKPTKLSLSLPLSLKTKARTESHDTLTSPTAGSARSSVSTSSGLASPTLSPTNAPLSPTMSALSGKSELWVQVTVSRMNQTEIDSEVDAEVNDEVDAVDMDGNNAGANVTWSVVKSSQDIVQLEQQLQSQLKKQEKRFGTGASCQHHHLLGIDYSEVRDLPHLVPASSSSSAEDRVIAMQTFLRQLVQSDTLGHSAIVQTFLELPAHSNVTEHADHADHHAEPTDRTSNSKLRGDRSLSRESASAAPAAASKKARLRVLQSLEVSLFGVLHEIFEMDGMGLVRRHLVTLTRSFLKAFVNASHFRKLERQFLSFTDATQLAGALSGLHDYLFPPATTPAAPVPPVELSDAAMQQLRKDSLDVLLASFPSVFVSLWSETACENAALKLHEFLQHQVFLKNLVCSMLDELLETLFPDAAGFARAGSRGT